MADMAEGGAASRRSLVTWILNPFYYLAGGQALALGLAFIVAAGLVGWTGSVHLDGVMDIHVGLPAPLWLFPAEGLVNWLSLSLMAWLAGLAVSRTRFRVLDVFGTQALARTPSILMVGAAFVPGFQTQAVRFATGNWGGAPAEISLFFAAMFVTVLAIVWMVALMYRAYATSCNVGGGKAAGAFIVALILAEVVSKAAIVGLLFLAVPGFRIWPY